MTVCTLTLMAGGSVKQASYQVRTYYTGKHRKLPPWKIPDFLPKPPDPTF